MSNLPKPRIALTLAFLSVALLSLAAVAGGYIRHAQRSVADAMHSNLSSLRAGQELELSTHELRSQIDRYLISSDYKQLEPIPRYRDRAANALVTAEKEATTPEEKQLMQRTRTGFDAFFAEFDRLSFGPPNRDSYIEILMLMDTVFAREVIEPTREYMRLNEGMLSRGSKDNQELGSRMSWALIGLGVCGIVGGALAGWLIAAGFRRVLRQNEARLRMTAQQLSHVMPRTPSVSLGNPSPDAVEEIGITASAVIARLQATERDALRAEQLAWVGQMAAGIAHEVRNPLMAVKMLIQARSDAHNRDRFRPKDLEILQEEIVRMEQIITMFLNFARPPQLAKKYANVNPVVAHVVAGVQARAAVQHVTLEARFLSVPIETHFDPNQISQVLYNLIFNALDAQPNGGTITIHVTTEESHEWTGPMVVLHVEDEGPGLPEAYGERIFEPFVSSKDTGMGLGLSICRRIVESHGGWILAANRLDRSGARLSVYLPLTLSDSDADSVEKIPMVSSMVK